MTADATKVTDAPLQFDRVVHSDPDATSRLTCASCGKPVIDTYYHAADTVLCASCGARRQADATPDRRGSTFLRAMLFGFGACLVGALAYWAVMEFLGLEIGIVAIAIGFFVGRAVATATRGRSARRHRILAVGLTYMAVGFAYAPFAFKELKSTGTASANSSTATTAAAPAAPATEAGGTATPAAASASDAPANTPATKAAASQAPSSAGTLALGFAALLGLILALPVIGALSSGAGGILSVLIIGFGLRQAWRISAAANTTVTGPLPVASAPAT